MPLELLTVMLVEPFDVPTVIGVELVMLGVIAVPKLIKPDPDPLALSMVC